MKSNVLKRFLVLFMAIGAAHSGFVMANPTKAKLTTLRDKLSDLNGNLSRCANKLDALKTKTASKKYSPQFLEAYDTVQSYDDLITAMTDSDKLNCSRENKDRLSARVSIPLAVIQIGRFPHYVTNAKQSLSGIDVQELSSKDSALSKEEKIILINMANNFNAGKEVKELTIADIIDDGTNINFQDEYGRTKLHRAAQSLNESEVDTLISKNADVNIRDIYGWTALRRALSGGSSGCKDQKVITMVKKLLENGAQIIVKEDLTHAIKSECLNIVLLLLQTLRERGITFTEEEKRELWTLMIQKRGSRNIDLSYIETVEKLLNQFNEKELLSLTVN